MIVGKIIGGLGNQMFQYAFYRYLADIKSVDLRLDINDFSVYTLHHGYELKRALSVNEKIATNHDINKDKTKWPLLFKAESKIFSKSILLKSNHFRERKFKIDEKLFNNSITDAYVEGYFQTHKYISTLSLHNSSIFSFETKLSSIEKSLVDLESVAIHIRGGDYINNRKDKALFDGICNFVYYKKAIKYFQSVVKNPRFIVFSDDEEYARKLLNGMDFTIVNWNQGENSYRDMFLMSQCKHNIIANSSFSWWAAWLNGNANKVVIAPRTWFNDPKFYQDDIIPDEWVKI